MDALDFNPAFENPLTMPAVPQSSPAHPRLLLANKKIAELKQQIKTDPVSRSLFECVERKAGQFLDAPPVIHKLDGKRLLAQSRKCLERVSTLSLAALLTDDARYAQRAIREMMAVAEFPDWNPSHFLDVAEMTLAVALGYDWLFDKLTADQRNTIASAILDKAVKLSFDPLAEKNWWTWWIKGNNNWTQVCHAGIVAGALALAENEPELAERAVMRAVENVPRSAAAYAPDGAYAEGATYWGYGTLFHVVLIDLLESTLGKDYGLADSPGFLESGDYILQMTAPGGTYYNYADGRATRHIEPPLFWLARRMDEPALLQSDLAMLEKCLAAYTGMESCDHNRLFSLTLLWWNPEFSARFSGKCGLPLHWMAAGPNPVSVHRSAWNDKDAVFVAIKGGSASVSHAHKDVGSFILEAGGVRWVVDLGVQEYLSLESAGVDLWNMKDGSQRWETFRLGTQGHSVPRFNGAQQLSAGKGEIVRFEGERGLPHTVIDLTSIYEDQVSKVMRGIALSENGCVLLQDEWTAGDKSVTVRWQIITQAKIAVNGLEFTLSQEGKQLTLKILEPAGVKIEVIDVSKPPMPYDAENPNTHAIAFECHTEAHKSGVIKVTAALADAGGDAKFPSKSLEEWSAALA